MAKRGFGGAVMHALGARDHEVVVTGTEWITEHFVRVHLTSETLFDELEPGPTTWVRFWFPDPEDPQVEHQRAYTISTYEAASGRFSVDMVVHEPTGPASHWAQHVAPGARVAVMSMGSRVFEVPEDPPAGYLVLGDPASTPAINAILETVPDEVPVELYLEEHVTQDRDIPLADHPRLRLHRIPRQGAGSLAAALEGRDWSDWSVWAGTEAGSLKALRSRLREDFGFPKSEIKAQAYWSQGRAFGRRRGGEEENAEVADPAPAPASPKGSWRADGGRRLLAPLTRRLVVAGLLQGVVTLLQLAPFVLLVELARLLLAGAEGERLWRLGLIAVLLLGLGALLESGLLLWLHLVDGAFARDLRERLLTTLGRLPLGWFDARGGGQVKKIVQDDTLSLHYLVTHAVPDAVAAIVAPLGVLAYLMWVDWRLGLALFIPVLVYLLTLYTMVLQSGETIPKAHAWMERMHVEAEGYLEGQPVVRVFGGGAASSFRARLDEFIAFLGQWQRPFTGKKTVMELVTRPMTFLGVIVVLGSTLVVAGMDPVDLLPFLFLGTTFGACLLGIGYGLSGMRDGLVAARNLQGVLDEEQLEVRDEGGMPRRDEPAGRVVLDDVHFAYRPGVPVIDGVDLVLEPGTVTALVGPSGSGKSTLAGLLARFHDVVGGSVRIGGRDVRTMTSEELYSRVGFVFQDAQVVRGTVHDNIVLARPDAGVEEVRAAAREAQIHERIMRMPQGYETVLDGPEGLSGGERQRLTIARAILADTPVLVLDEATAFADPESEYLVQRALDRLARGRTVLVIAHRLRTVTDVDRIVVLDHGRVVETGRHEQLRSAGGRYRELWDAGERTTVEALR